MAPFSFSLTWIKVVDITVCDNVAMESPATLTREAIARLVDTFYDRVQADPVIGPVFNAAVHDWPAHKATLVQFWSSVALGTREYRGNPMAVHRAQPAIEDAHFGHWLALWRTTAHEVLGEADGEVMYEYAQRIGQSLRYGLGFDGLRPPGSRLPMHPGG